MKIKGLKTYWAEIEYVYDKKSSEYGKLKGGFVYAFVQATDARDALFKFNKRLKEERIIPISIEYISKYEKDIEWETEELTKKYNQLAIQTKETTNVIFDEFYAFKNKDL